MSSRVGAGVAGRVTKIAHEVKTAKPRAVTRGALAAKKALVAEIQRDAPGLRLRGVGLKGAKLGVSFNVKGTQDPTALVRATGPLHLIERPSKPHEIRPRRRGRRAVLTPYGPRSVVNHPGVRNPRQPWKRGLPKAQREAEDATRDTFSAAWRRGLR